MSAIADAEDFDADLSETLVREAELVGDGFGNIEHTAANEGPTVIHADFGGFSILEIRNSYEARERKGFVSGGAGPWPELLADGCFAGKDQEMFTVV